MKICLSTKQFFDNEGKPLSDGRISVYLHGTDTLADIATLEGSAYVQSPNPFNCAGDGRIPGIFFDAAVVDVKVESDNGDGTFELLDTYSDGFDIPAGSSATSVYGIDALKDVQPTAGMVVTVTGSADGVLAPTRHYVYDPQANETADDGVVVESDHGDGRWLLLWDCDTLPCTVYGIVPGNEANIAAFLQYPDHLGQWDIRTPSKPRFLSGTYAANTIFTTTKTVKFDRGAKFPNAYFNLPAMETDGGGDDYIADFHFARQGVARLSWFRSLSAFWTCNADKLVLDRDQLADKTITTSCAVTGKTVEGAMRVSATYTEEGYLKFSNCEFNARGIFNPTMDKVKFQGARWDDNLWTTTYSAASFNFVKFNGSYAGAFVDFLSVNGNSPMNVIELKDFGNADIYVKAKLCDIANSLNVSTKLYLEGRRISGLAASVLEEVHDATIDGLCDLAGGSVSLFNVRAQSVKFTGTTLNAHNSEMYLADGSSFSNLFGERSKFAKSTAWDIAPLLNLYDCEWSVGMAASNDNETDVQPASFTKCHLHDCTIIHKRLALKDCTVTACQLGIYPYKSGSAYYMNFIMEGCTVNNAVPVTFQKFADAADDVNNITPDIRIVNNTFAGNAYGIRVPFYSNVTNRSLFFKAGRLTGIVYSGNGGECPADSAQVSFSNDWTAETAYDTDLSNSGYVSPVELRAFPTASQRTALTSIDFGKWTQEYSLTDNLGEGISTENRIGRHIVHSVQLTTWNAQEQYNDFFSLRYYSASNPNKPIIIM